MTDFPAMGTGASDAIPVRRHWSWQHPDVRLYASSAASRTLDRVN
jgi:hypothetical protein